jgi:hypothetical protein
MKPCLIARFAFTLSLLGGFLLVSIQETNAQTLTPVAKQAGACSI